MTPQNGPHRLSDEEVSELVTDFVKRSTGSISLLGNPVALLPLFSGSDPEAKEYRSLNRDFPPRCAEVLHELLLQGIIMHAPDVPTADVFELTSRGREMLEQDFGMLTDPSGYLGVVANVPGMDALTVEYLAEAVHSYRRFLDRASAVMLGGAAENLLLRLAGALSEASGKLNLPARSGLTDWRVSKVRDAVVDTVKDRAFLQALEPTLAQQGTALTAEDKTALRETESSVMILSNFYADTRNDAGHPRPVRPHRQILHAYLRAFPEYASRVSDALEILGRLP